MLKHIAAVKKIVEAGEGMEEVYGITDVWSLRVSWWRKRECSWLPLCDHEAVRQGFLPLYGGIVDRSGGGDDR